ncbi:MAG: beta-N-acetylhexosaminidase [Bacteroidota bacterium]
MDHFIKLASLFLFFSCATPVEETTTALFDEGIYLIPYPQEVTLGGEDFVLDGEVSVVLDRDATVRDRFAAKELATQLKKEWGVNAVLTDSPSGKSIILTQQGVPRKVTDLPEKKALQGYQLTTDAHQLIIRAKGEAGLYYGTQTLLQIIKKGEHGAFVPGLEITDWPDIPERACHYDTKHHQDKRTYVESFIRDLARVKINMLVWEWEDKFAYPSHPEIGAPGAFTMEEMQEITRYAQQYHVQLVPLVQGLGHVSYILKWPQHSHLREVPASNWEFCPQKEGTYELLNDLWQDAIKATPGSQYIHIGTDESYELGKGVACGCKAEMEKDGKHAMMTRFITRSAEPLIKEGRTVMAWSAEYLPGAALNPPVGMVILGRGSAKPDHLIDIKKAGYELHVYDPNPGIETLFLPYFYRLRGEGDDEKEVDNCLQRSYNEVARAAGSGEFDGMINTSWDDAGLHNQIWMMSFINSAEWSWSGNNPTLEEFANKYFLNYYGEQSSDMRELHLLLNKAGYYYYTSFERRVWHYGDIGKTHLPVLPRGDNLEYDEYWNREYAAKIEESHEQIKQMERAMEIIRINQEAGVKNSYDLVLFTTITELVSHTCNTYLALSELERAIKEAHNQRFLSHQAAYRSLENAIGIIDANLSERQKVYDELVAVWEKTRLPKGFSTEEKEFFHRQDRARHFAFRRADMSYLIYDEELLGLEDYREKLLEYMEWYKKTYLF